MVSISVVHWYMAENGWTFDPADGVIPDTVNDAQFVYQIYTKANSNYSGRVTVPVLWDKKTKNIVSNESSEIIRMFNSAFDSVGATYGDYYPEHLRQEIDSLNDRIYSTVNNGVYRCGFATTQEAYEEVVTPLFDTLDWLENILSTNHYLTGSQITEADWRLFTTLIRFDPVYVGHFKCNIRRIVDYPNLSNYLSDLYQQPGIAETVNMKHIKEHYYASHETINPSRIVPTGPDIDFTKPHNRQ
jgi:putative glutathione S-transferase